MRLDSRYHNVQVTTIVQVITIGTRASEIEQRIGDQFVVLWTADMFQIERGHADRVERCPFQISTLVAYHHAIDVVTGEPDKVEQTLEKILLAEPVVLVVDERYSVNMVRDKVHHFLVLTRQRALLSSQSEVFVVQLSRTNLD